MHAETQSITRPTDVTAEWLTQALRRSGHLDPAGVVRSVTHRPFGTGQSGESHRFSVEYEAGGRAGPPTLVAKFASEDAEARAFAAAAGMYAREVRFYRELAGDIAVRSPSTIHVEMTHDEQQFVVLMEDLAPAVVVDQLVGLSADQAAVAVEQAAALHAGSWRRRDLSEAAWLRTTSVAIGQIADVLPDFHAAFVERFGGVIDAVALEQAELMVAHRHAWAAATQDQCCLWHQDFRADNFLFEAVGGAVPLAVVDWQTVGMGPGTADVAYCLGTSLTVEDRRAHERDLVAHYHQALIAGGVRDYDADACWHEYRRNVAQAIFTVIHAGVRAARTPRGDEMWRVWADRSAIQAADIGTFEVLGG